MLLVVLLFFFSFTVVYNKYANVTSPGIGIRIKWCLCVCMRFVWSAEITGREKKEVECQNKVDTIRRCKHGIILSEGKGGGKYDKLADVDRLAAR